MYQDAGYIEHIPYIFICAGFKEGGKDSCEVTINYNYDYEVIINYNCKFYCQDTTLVMTSGPCICS